MRKILLFSSVIASSLCGGIHASHLAPQDNLSSSAHEDVQDRDLLFLDKFGPVVVILQLFDATTGRQVIDLYNGLVVFSTEPSFSANANVVYDSAGSVTFEWTSEVQGVFTTVNRVENTRPYALCANDGAKYFSCPNLSFGRHRLEVKACSKRNGRGKCSNPVIVSFRIERPAPTVPTAPLATSAPQAATAPTTVVAPTATVFPLGPFAPKAIPAPMVPATRTPAAPAVPSVPTAPTAPSAPMVPSIQTTPT